MIRTAVLLLAVLLGAAAPADAQDFPSKPIRLVVPYPAGGSTDILGRLIAQKLSDALGQQVVVDNRAGAGGNIGTEIVAKAPGDGYTISVGGGANTINATLYKNLSFDFARDLVPLGMIGTVPNMMVVPPSSPAKTPQEFISYAKANQGKLNYASSGNGATTHMAGELFKSVTGVQMQHVPYRGSSPALQDLMAGRVDVMFDNFASSVQLVKSGQLRALALTGPERQEALPDVPTLKELGIDVEAVSFFALYAPASTPRAIVERYNSEIRKIVKMPDVRARLADFGASPKDMSSEELAAFTRSEIKKWAKVIEISGARID